MIIVTVAGQTTVSLRSDPVSHSFVRMGPVGSGLFAMVPRLNIKSVSQLRALLLDMETTLGLVDLSPNERDVLYAINEVAAGQTRAARSDAIRSHPLAAAIPQATYHRALKSLVQRGLVKHAPDTKAGAYVVTGQINEAGQA